MISVKVVNERAPDVGKGRWTIPPYLLKDKLFLEYVDKSGKEAEEKAEQIKNSRNNTQNIQRIYSSFKKDIMQTARERDRAVVPKVMRQIRELENELERINGSEMPELKRNKEAAEVKAKIVRLENQRHQKRRVEVAALNRIEGETIGTYWSGEGAETLGDQYEKNSPQMAELARDYHSELQNQGNKIDVELRETCTNKVLSALETRVSDEHSKMLKARITSGQVELALSKGQSRNAAGIDGVTYELLNKIHLIYTEDAKLQEKQAENNDAEESPIKFNIVQLLTDVFNDIDQCGVDETTGFFDGWMCPLYKKNDRNEIANYRPLTILNTDYKILTTVLAMKLAMVAPQLLHVSQAGFVPGRRITNQTKLIELMIEYAEASKQNDLIVALDQEKAYDKIAHDYL